MRVVQFSLSSWSWPLGLFALGFVASCGQEDNVKAAAQAAPPQAPAVVVAELQTAVVPIFRDFVARTEAVETIEIEARVEAILESMEFEEGRRVKKDQVLYRLDPRSYAANLAVAKASLAQARANEKLAKEQVSVRAAEAGLTQTKALLKKAEQDVARLRPLAEKDAVPRQDLDTALAAEEVAVAEVDVQEAVLKNARISEEVGLLMAKAQVESSQASVDLAQLDLDYCTITSPIDGLVGRTQINVGNLVGKGQTTELVTVSGIDPMYVTFAISEAEYLELVARTNKEGEREERRPVELILADGSTFDQVGHVLTADRAVAVETGTLQLVALFANPAGDLRPGQFGRVRLQVQEYPAAVLVPQRSVMEQQGTKIVYVVGEGDKISLRTISVGERYEGSYVVLDGLEAGERVVVEGQLKVRPGSTVRPMDKAASSEPEEEQ